ncbi:MAG TPA: dienelactone hydrolase family protein [Tepidiformaceae bacterium]|nr:dienelactone hydrolase family protein [Tepidiformaceae bacterium]
MSMPPGETPEDLTLRVQNVSAMPHDEPGVYRLLIETSRGEIAALLRPVEGGTGAVVFAGGAGPGIPLSKDSIYDLLPLRLAARGVTSMHIAYRKNEEFEECVLDILGACSVLRGIGATDVALVGHSMGGAVVIKAGQLAVDVRGVVALAPQLFGTRQVEELGKPLILIHGTNDTVLNHEASEDIYRRALDPKEIVLFEGAGHSLIDARDQIADLLEEWIPARFAGEPMLSKRTEVPME